jgi:hypothetical protein
METDHGKTGFLVFPIYNNVGHSGEIGKAEFLTSVSSK